MPGATTIALTTAQADLAARTSALWIQGGTPADPILNQPYPGQYGFGALRCAIDNLNGDNVEWISVPQGSRHVFCYAYYVQPPPTSGTIIVRKAVNAPAGAAATAFPFTGNISFEPDQSFTVSAAPDQQGAMTFYRAGGSDWSFKEQVPAGWQLASLTCAAAGTSTSTVDPAGAAATVHLVGGDVVTCTFTDDFHPPPAALTLAKVTSGGVGTFRFDVSGPSDGTATATTTAPDTQVTAAPTFDDLPAGTYTIAEQRPSSDAGNWALSAVRCNALPMPVSARVSVDISPGQATLCTFFNDFTPAGSIRLRKITLGATATVGFVVTDASDQLQNTAYEQHATTTKQGVAVLAQGDDTSKLPLGSYDIRETTPSGTDGGGWRVESVLCNGIPVGSAQGRTRVTLTQENPDLDCTITDRFIEDAAPGGGAKEPPPGIGVGGIKVVSPKTNLAVTKTATPTRIRTGQAVRYRVTVDKHQQDRDGQVGHHRRGSTSEPAACPRHHHERQLHQHPAADVLARDPQARPARHADRHRSHPPGRPRRQSRSGQHRDRRTAPARQRRARHRAGHPTRALHRLTFLSHGELRVGAARLSGTTGATVGALADRKLTFPNGLGRLRPGVRWQLASPQSHGGWCCPGSDTRPA